MKYRFVLLAALAVVIAACSSGTSDTTAVPTTAAPTTVASPPVGDVAAGGTLYDKWWKAAGVDKPAGDQPLWATQTTNTRSGADTWRCKECHGWDYRGVDGVYGSGSHSTGFPGIWDAQSKSYDELKTVLTTGDHDFSAMGEESLVNLIAFIQTGLVDDTLYISADKTLIGADLTHGEELYTGTCIGCHGADGTTINFGSAEEPEFVGTLASDNPWEGFHKIRVGQPGEPMPSALNSGWSLQDMLDVLGYAQTLPTVKGSDASVLALGGRLYDKWFGEIGVDAPAGDMPKWAGQTTNTRTGADTWRCKECHGWDYMGVDGVYGSGSHMTGFPGVWDAREWTVEQIVAQLSGVNDADHNFSEFLSADQMAALAAFIREGAFDKTTLFDVATKAPTSGDLAAGEAAYSTVCAACHGADGKQINFGDDTEPEYVGTIMVDNPWEGSHKIMFGNPGAGMPTGIESGMTVEQLLDLITFLQTLPIS